MADPSSASLGGDLYDSDQTWQDWLRWDPLDPTAEPLSPSTTSKDSNQSHSPNNAALQQPSMFSLGKEDGLPPPMIMGDEADIVDLGAAYDGPAWNLTGDEDQTASFLFGGDTEETLQPIVNNLQMDGLASDNVWPQATVTGNAPQSTRQPSLQSSQVGQNMVVPSSGNLGASYASSSTAHSIASQSPHSSTQEPPQKKKPGRKRKTSDSNDGSTASPEGEPPVKKTSHNVIEKRYRNNLNDKIVELRDSVPSLRAMSRPNGDDGSENLEGLAPAHKLNKTTVMAKATEYIKHLEKRNKTLSDEMDEMRARLNALENAIGGSRVVAQQQAAATSRHAADMSPGLLSQPQYAQHHATPVYEAQTRPGQQTNHGSSGLASKLMVGTMAGLMVMEGIHEHDPSAQTTAGRGLYAVPAQLFRRMDILPNAKSSPATHLAWSLLRIAILLGAIVFLVLPWFKSQPPRKAHPLPVRLEGAPSLASPVEARREAWLTAVRSVWTPRPFLIEVVAVGVRMLKLSLRRLIGSERYFMISGISKEDEAARIKAWDIAIDAQLAGGDAQVSYYRLLLTLMASGTLPDSPMRLMQKAVHFRMFFWEVANAGYGNMLFFQSFTAKVAKIYWDLARTQHKALAAGEASAQDDLDSIVEPLPDYLASLIGLDCDEVLTNEIIQRAYNLAWNRPSAENTASHPTLDSVVEDHAVRSPLDAIAAWFSNTMIDEALALTLQSGSEESIGSMVEVAVKAAPPASVTEARALVARAVLIDEGREANIAAALAKLPSSRSHTPLIRPAGSTLPMNLVDHVPLSPDIKMALSLAKIASIASPTNPATARVRAATALSAITIVPANLSLLTAVAAQIILETFAGDDLLFSNGTGGLETLSTSLRVWIGSRAGKRAGLDVVEKRRLVESCLGVAKKLGGWRDEDADSGYGSVSRTGSDMSVVA